MKVKGIIDEDFVNYKLCSMFIAFPTCTWKCGKGLCQNSALATSDDIEISIDDIVDRFINNPLSEAIVLGGLEPMDSFEEVCRLIRSLRRKSNCMVVIYTGYDTKEIPEKMLQLMKSFSNITLKLGRYLPNQRPHFDETLGVNLQSDNQYGVVIA